MVEELLIFDFEWDEAKIFWGLDDEQIVYRGVLAFYNIQSLRAYELLAYQIGCQSLVAICKRGSARLSYG